MSVSVCCVHQVKEDLVRLLLPYLMAGLGPDITADYRAASLMIITQLATQATLSDTLVTGQQETSQTHSSWHCCLFHLFLELLCCLLQC